MGMRLRHYYNTEYVTEFIIAEYNKSINYRLNVIFAIFVSFSYVLSKIMIRPLFDSNINGDG